MALLKAKPGALNYASSGAGTPYHMAGELFKAMSETNIVHVPHRGSGEARNNTIGGHVQMMFDAVTTMARERRGRPGAGARHLRRVALDRAAGRADHRRGRPAGLRRHHLARRHGAGRHAEADRRPAQRRDQQGARPRPRPRRPGPSRVRCRSS